MTLLGVDGERLAERELVLGRSQALQWNDVFAEMGAAPRPEASAVVEVIDGGAVIAHVIRIDNQTNDASFLPGRILRPQATSPASGR